MSCFNPKYIERKKILSILSLYIYSVVFSYLMNIGIILIGNGFLVRQRSLVGRGERASEPIGRCNFD